jgi:hypothetical protein
MKVGEIFGQEQTLTTSQKFLRVVIQFLLDFNFHHHEDGLSTLQSASVNLTLIVAWSQLIACIEKKLTKREPFLIYKPNSLVIHGREAARWHRVIV